MYPTGIWSCSASFSVEAEQKLQINIGNSYNNLTDSYAM